VVGTARTNTYKVDINLIKMGSLILEMLYYYKIRQVIHNTV